MDRFLMDCKWRPPRPIDSRSRQDGNHLAPHHCALSTTACSDSLSRRTFSLLRIHRRVRRFLEAPINSLAHFPATLYNAPAAA